MTNRVTKFRVWYGVFIDGVYKNLQHKEFFTPAATAEFISKSTRKPKSKVTSSGCYFHSVQVGNSNGWTDYDIEHNSIGNEIIPHLLNAKETHLAFFDDGDGVKFL